jgi:ribonuclease HI
MKGVWKGKSGTSQHFVPLIRELLDGYDVTFEWVPREKNKEADMLSSMAYKQYCSKQGRDAVFMKRR